MTSIVALMSVETRNVPKIERMPEGMVRVKLGNLVIHMDMAQLRDFCNDIAEVLDDWYEERDRNGAL